MVKKLNDLRAEQEKDLLKMREIIDTAKKEKRELKESEKKELKQLKEDIQLREIEMLRYQNAQITPAVVKSREAAVGEYLRKVMTDGSLQKGAVMQREAIVKSGVEEITPLTMNDIIKPLEEGLILSTVGLKLQTGLSGSYVWPTLAAVEASVAGENVALSDSTINLDKIVPTPARVGITIPFTNQALNASDGALYGIVTEQLTMGVTRALNKVMFSPETTNGNKLDGPFVACKAAEANAISALTTKAKRKAAVHVTFAGELPTYKELLSMKGLILAKGIVNDGTLAYVMDEYTKSQLESTPRDAGSGLMIIENGMIAGVPVFCTNYINEDGGLHVGLGVWSYEALGQFGDMRFIVDPYTGATKDTVRATLNGDWSMTTLRKEAFVLGDCTVL